MTDSDLWKCVNRRNDGFFRIFCLYNYRKLGINKTLFEYFKRKEKNNKLYGAIVKIFSPDMDNAKQITDIKSFYIVFDLFFNNDGLPDDGCYAIVYTPDVTKRKQIIFELEDVYYSDADDYGHKACHKNCDYNYHKDFKTRCFKRGGYFFLR